ncbi:MAG: N-acetyl-gamma-glutamyl-phosphate reductase [Planctomycetes bacterium]|nr:N-acetyl-gamma-glutamyl-phosphate reductase [Planctomycetota bacterium]
MTRVSVVGASGYVGGELLRWLVDHPSVELGQATSERLAGQPLARVHPHLRGATRVRFCKSDELEPCDLLFLALPHGKAVAAIGRFAELSERVIDCSADFRLRDASAYEHWYGREHPRPKWLERFQYGLPEVARHEIAGAHYVSGVGCNAAAVQLALLPLERAGLLSRGMPVVAEVKAGSSEAGATPSASSHHAIRAGVVRSFAPVGHRHGAEVEQTFEGLRLQLSVTSVEMVRGALATCHVQLEHGLEEVEVLRAYRRFASEEPFVDVVHERTGLYRHPEPKLLAGTNRAQVGFALDPRERRIVLLCAIDNLGKGAAGSAVQSMNLMLGLDETTGLGFRGLHPI